MKVLHNSCNTVTCGLPDMSTLSPQALGVHIRQTTCVCVTTIKYRIKLTGRAADTILQYFPVNLKHKNIYSTHLSSIPTLPHMETDKVLTRWTQH